MAILLDRCHVVVVCYPTHETEHAYIYIYIYVIFLMVEIQMTAAFSSRCGGLSQALLCPYHEVQTRPDCDDMVMEAMLQRRNCC
jgi:hypothetical protein